MNAAAAARKWITEPDRTPSPPARERVLGQSVERWLFLLCVVALPALVVATVPIPLNQAWEIDPSLYSALSTDYGELTDRFGATYYATRVSYIALASLFYSAFGFDIGYMLLRFVLLSIACAAVFVLVRAWFGLATAVLLAGLTAMGPWLLRALLWDYTDGPASTYLLAALALAADRNGQAWRAVAAGAVFAFAVNAGTFNIAIGGAFFFSWLLLVQLNWARTARRVLLIGMGFIVAYAVMIVAVYQAYPVMGPFFESINFNTSRSLLSGGGSQWFTPLRYIVDAGMYFPFVPPVTLIVLGVLLVGRGPNISTGLRRAQIAAFLYLGIICAGIGFMHFVLRMPTLGLPWGVILAFPATIFAWAAIIAPALNRLSVHRQAIIVGGALVVVLAFFLLARLWLPGFRTQWDAWDPEFGAALAALFAIAALVRVARSYALIALVLIGAHIPYRMEDNFYARIHVQERRQEEFEIRRAGVDLLRLVSAQAPLTDGRTVIWHPSPAPLAYHAICSFLFWGYSLIDMSGGGLPNLTSDDETDIRNAGFLVIMAPTAPEVEAGLQTLDARGIDYAIVDRDEWSGQTFSFFYALANIERVVEQAEEAEPLHVYAPSEMLVYYPDLASATVSGAAVDIVSDARAWAYSAYLPLGQVARGSQSAMLLVDAEVEVGAFQIIIDSLPNVVRPPPQAFVHAGRRENVLLPIDTTQDQTLVIANGAARSRSVGTIHSVRIVRLPPPSAQ